MSSTGIVDECFDEAVEQFIDEYRQIPDAVRQEAYAQVKRLSASGEAIDDYLAFTVLVNTYIDMIPAGRRLFLSGINGFALKPIEHPVLSEYQFSSRPEEESKAVEMVFALLLLGLVVIQFLSFPPLKPEHASVFIVVLVMSLMIGVNSYRDSKKISELEVRIAELEEKVEELSEKQ